MPRSKKPKAAASRKKTYSSHTVDCTKECTADHNRKYRGLCPNGGVGCEEPCSVHSNNKIKRKRKGELTWTPREEVVRRKNKKLKLADGTEVSPLCPECSEEPPRRCVKRIRDGKISYRAACTQCLGYKATHAAKKAKTLAAMTEGDQLKYTVEKENKARADRTKHKLQEEKTLAAMTEEDRLEYTVKKENKARGYQKKHKLKQETLASDATARFLAGKSAKEKKEAVANLHRTDEWEHFFKSIGMRKIPTSLATLQAHMKIAPDLYTSAKYHTESIKTMLAILDDDDHDGLFPLDALGCTHPVLLGDAYPGITLDMYEGKSAQLPANILFDLLKAHDGTTQAQFEKMVADYWSQQFSQASTKEGHTEQHVINICGTVNPITGSASDPLWTTTRSRIPASNMIVDTIKAPHLSLSKDFTNDFKEELHTGGEHEGKKKWRPFMRKENEAELYAKIVDFIMDKLTPCSVIVITQCVAIGYEGQPFTFYDAIQSDGKKADHKRKKNCPTVRRAIELVAAIKAALDKKEAAGTLADRMAPKEAASGGGGGGAAPAKRPGRTAKKAVVYV